MATPYLTNSYIRIAYLHLIHIYHIELVLREIIFKLWNKGRSVTFSSNTMVSMVTYAAYMKHNFTIVAYLDQIPLCTPSLWKTVKVVHFKR